MSGKDLRGRAGECATLRQVLSSVRSAESRALVIRGEAGVGKSALVDFVIGEAEGFQLVQVAGVESDMELAYAGLQQLCAPLMDRVDEVPSRNARRCRWPSAGESDPRLTAFSSGWRCSA